ncbi:Uncharacterized protein TPAR_05235 [Tolypocladium paradoxum]|uniref:F-box domain-containing protein n=1 Tax=Tolypocladium paradoxum TaxID=94208 RepID=A0A2S4KWN7_9HYPO|nr:Uncharacterized protein TPAR_05235 [Tolypocladium paradoxum]
MARALADIMRGRRSLPWDKGDATTGPRECLPHEVNSRTTPVDCEHGIALDPIQPGQAHSKRPKMLSRVTARALPFRRRSLLGHLMTLPAELWLEILSYLDFGEILRVRRTCKALRNSVSRSTVQFLVPHWRRARWSTCTVCLRYSPAHTRVFYEATADGGTNYLPDAPECVECIAQRNGFRVGSRYFMGRHGAVRICRYCGQPIVTEPAPGHEEFHGECHSRHLGNRTWHVVYFGIYVVFSSVAAYICIWSHPRGIGIVAMVSVSLQLSLLFRFLALASAGFHR